MIRSALLVAALLALPSLVYAQNAVDVDPEHHRVVFEDEQVRIIRVTYPAGYTTPLHEHNQNVVVILADAHLENTAPDGTVQSMERQAGDSGRSAGANHASENVSTEPFEAVMIEFKRVSPVPAP